MEAVEFALEKLEYQKKKIDVILNDIEDIKNKLLCQTNEGFMRLLRDEKYRIEVALSISKSKKEACVKLGMGERTFYRKLAEYNL